MIVDNGDQIGLLFTPTAVGRQLGNSRSVHDVSLPYLVGIVRLEGAALLLFRVSRIQIIIADTLDIAVQGCAARKNEIRFALELTDNIGAFELRADLKNGIDRFSHLRAYLAKRAQITTRIRAKRFKTAALKAIVPALQCVPGIEATTAIRQHKWRLCAFLQCVTNHLIRIKAQQWCDGAEAHLRHCT